MLANFINLFKIYGYLTERFKSLILFTEFQHWSPLKMLFGRVKKALRYNI